MTLAIMPFQSIPAGADDLLELGLSDTLISRLGQLAEVRVLPLTATQRWRGQDPREAARELGATHALTGLLQRETGRVRATVHLLSSLMIERFNPIDADSSNTFLVQDVIVSRVIEELAPRLTAGRGADSPSPAPAAATRSRRTSTGGVTSERRRVSS